MRSVSLFSLLACSTASMAAIEVSSKAAPDGSVLTQSQVFAGFGCSGQNISPDLSWSAGPQGTKSYAVTMYDPDAPTGSGWWHWVVYNLPASTLSLPVGAGTPDGAKLPAGAVQGKTDFGGPGFGGACPPPGDKPHRYIVTVYALGTEKIEVAADSTGAMVGFMIHANMLDKGSITTTYSR
ncbi:phosphatidylethanolamine-binding protein [Alteromonas lipolytica]|uniref:Phosphatidylethanolamine-binding protein n=1 Tax=Alteromonas lipolytica TaxID=1856405 RepID=A0A1E8FCH9_9ALTE|nr:phosphatidylethanolamine-binding protein [Alteromonas lipolytica]